MITLTAEGGRRLDYFDFTTRRSWCCGTAPSDVSERDVLGWVLEKAARGDVILQAGRVWMIYPPHDEMFVPASQADHDGA